MAEPGSGTRRPRADKERNRHHILEVAEQYFSEQGVDGSMDAVAKRAGIGPGTLYRHFPNRDALLAGLLQERNEALVARRDAIEREETDPGAALAAWLDALREWVTAFDGLPDPLRTALSQESSPLAMTCEGFVTTTDAFLAEAQRVGEARPEVRGRDLFLGVLATAWVNAAALADGDSDRALRALLRSGWESPTTVVDDAG